jgi:hypothetical protein
MFVATQNVKIKALVYCYCAFFPSSAKVALWPAATEEIDVMRHAAHV